MRMEQRGDDVLLWVKAVPGASRDQIAGAIGDRLKIRISAAPEAGKANAAICELLARTLGVKPRAVAVESGGTGPEKILRITGVTAAHVQERLGMASP